MNHRLCAAALLVCLIAGCTAKSDPTALMPASAAGAPTPDRGRYLATSVSLCAFCHSEVDWTAEGFPPKPGTIGGGRAPFNPEQLPWLTSPNISPDRETGAGTWSDAQFESALRRGIGHDGRTLFPLMPYGQFHGMSDDDATSIVQFLRSIPPVKHEVPPTKVPEDLKATLAPLSPAGKVPAPDRSETAAYGEYLAHIGLCAQCHTPKDSKGRPSRAWSSRAASGSAAPGGTSPP